MHNDNLLVGFDTSDDASVFRVDDNLGLVQSIDFFPPMVDDPFLFGQIAAANSLSDIYAMGGRPSHAMNLLCIPSCLGVEIAGQILAGADPVIAAKYQIVVLLMISAATTLSVVIICFLAYKKRFSTEGYYLSPALRDDAGGAA